ncbi:MAG: 5-bromo-4-chloroindolyl phosphate hydrolysis family protein [Oscillospiraceae bacterium]|nr:5-bromo-4-chloroindolyl phosphate hydrolysis family protein [Oscillospiraceae bacterium]
MIEIKRKSVIPIYGVAVLWALYCLIFPLFRTWHLVVLACSGVLAYAVLTLIFPGKVELIEVPEEPERTGDEKIDALLAEGEKAVSEMSRLRESIPDEDVRLKLDEIIPVTDSIFKKLLYEPGVYKQVRRFADYYLPTTIKLLHTYDRFGKSGSGGENIMGTLKQIDSALDAILSSYKKFFDSLFADRALDIETDIDVLETILKRDGLL